MNPVRRLTGMAPLIVVLLVAPVDVSAQTPARPRTPTRPTLPPPPPPPTIALRGFAEGGLDRFAASRSFNAILGKDSGPVYGGGGEVVVKGRWFARVGFWRFEDQGERAVRLENQTFRLGIPLPPRER